MERSGAKADISAWIARIVVGAVFIGNVSCALRFIISPENYVAAYELSGVSGAAAVRGLGIAFLMWNATYPPVLLDPRRHSAIFSIVLAQQTIGLAGEAAIWLTIPVGHQVLSSGIARFALFDGTALVMMAAAFALLRATRRT